MIAPPITLRHPEPTDVEPLADVHLRCWQETYAGQLPHAFFGDTAWESRRRTWQAIVNNHGQDMFPWVAEADDHVIGFSMAAHPQEEDDVRDFQLFMLYVLKEFHGTGAGQELMDASLGDEPSQLWMAKDNPRARRFYEKNGFVADGAERIDSSSNGLKTIRMVRWSVPSMTTLLGSHPSYSPAAS